MEKLKLQLFCKVFRSSLFRLQLSVSTWTHNRKSIQGTTCTSCQQTHPLLMVLRVVYESSVKIFVFVERLKSVWKNYETIYELTRQWWPYPPHRPYHGSTFGCPIQGVCYLAPDLGGRNLVADNSELGILLLCTGSQIV